MGRFEPTGQLYDASLEHSALALPWQSVHGADGPSDGSMGAASNIPSALAVLRNANLYVDHPEEIEDAFTVLRYHPIRYGLLYPVAVAVTPFLLDNVRTGSSESARITDMIAEYVAAAGTLEPFLFERMCEIIELYDTEVLGWLGRHDRAVAAIAIHVPALRARYLVQVALAREVSPITLLALIELDAAPGDTLRLASEMLDSPDSATGMCAAAFLSRFAEHTPAGDTRIDAALPPWAPVALSNLAGKLWKVQLARPKVAPVLHTGEVTFAGERWVIVKTGARTVTLPWIGATVRRGDHVQVGLTAHGRPRLVMVTGEDGSVTIVDF